MADGIVDIAIKDYTVQEDATLATFITEVNNNLTAGWKLFGTPFHDGTNYCQAMVRIQTINRGD
tara:strand:- start:1421 stop:1612 length:192 start_codon:yes stop_codon:yes gene_type:complete